MYSLVHILAVLFTMSAMNVNCKRGPCNQKPAQATSPEPNENRGLFRLVLETKESNTTYLPDQTYVLKLLATDDTRPFKLFMITVESPNSDRSSEPPKDVGTLKTLDTDSKARFSEACANTVEHTDFSDKDEVVIHWLSPKQSMESNSVRFRAMVAENGETWYAGDSYLTIDLAKDNNKDKDTPPLPIKNKCRLCSEARYEVIFKGLWSRVTHPRHYPSRPDSNGYSIMIGASHDGNYSLWAQGRTASPGMQELVLNANVTVIEREIINHMSEDGGSRTLIRGLRRHHPHMSEPSYSLFRVDSIHHMFSLAVAMRPSPDWFLGTSNFELCNDTDWLESYEMPLYPWDAGIADGVSYESVSSPQTTAGNIERVAVGSFDRNSPFYQMNLNDLKPFAMLTVNRLDVYPLLDCTVEDDEDDKVQTEEEPIENLEPEETVTPMIGESRHRERCHVTWGEWTPCVTDQGACGAGRQWRAMEVTQRSFMESSSDSSLMLQEENCDGPETDTIQTQECFVEC